MFLFFIVLLPNQTQPLSQVDIGISTLRKFKFLVQRKIYISKRDPYNIQFRQIISGYYGIFFNSVLSLGYKTNTVDSYNMGLSCVSPLISGFFFL